MIHTKNLLQALREHLLREDSFLAQQNISVSFQIPKETLYPHIVLEAQKESESFEKSLFGVTTSVFSLDSSGQEAEALMEKIGLSLRRLRRFQVQGQTFTAAFERHGQKRSARSPYTLIRQDTCFTTTTLQQTA